MGVNTINSIEVAAIGLYTFFLKVILSNQSLDIRFSGTIARNDPARIPYHNGM